VGKESDNRQNKNNIMKYQSFAIKTGMENNKEKVSKNI
jgi:hypothetical protein